MQQSLHVLQAPLTELRSLIETELRSNPALEEILPDKPDIEKKEDTSALDEQWNEYYIQRKASEPWTREALERRQHFLDSQVRPPSLSEHLLEQLLTASWPKEESAIAVEIIGNLDDGGYLRSSIEDIASSVDATMDEVEHVLLKVQEFEPAGIAARTLSECLILQLERWGKKYSN